MLRGVGFRSGNYHDTNGLLPLTARRRWRARRPTPPSTPRRSSRSGWPRANYFGALGGERTHVADPHSGAVPQLPRGIDPTTGLSPTTPSAPTSHLGFRLFYSGARARTSTGTAGSRRSPDASPTSGAPSTPTAVIVFGVRATGDPSAGVQQVWVTWTGGPDSTARGDWSSRRPGAGRPRLDALDRHPDRTTCAGRTATTPVPGAGRQRRGRRRPRHLRGRRLPSGRLRRPRHLRRRSSPRSRRDDSPLGVTATVTDTPAAPIADRRVVLRRSSRTARSSTASRDDRRNGHVASASAGRRRCRSAPSRWSPTSSTPRAPSPTRPSSTSTPPDWPRRRTPRPPPSGSPRRSSTSATSRGGPSDHVDGARAALPSTPQLTTHRHRWSDRAPTHRSTGGPVRALRARPAARRRRRLIRPVRLRARRTHHRRSRPDPTIGRTAPRARPCRDARGAVIGGGHLPRDPPRRRARLRARFARAQRR